MLEVRICVYLYFSVYISWSIWSRKDAACDEFDGTFW